MNLSTLRSPKQLAEIAARFGHQMDSFDANDVEAKLGDPDLPTGLRELLECRLYISKTSTSKLVTMLRCAGGDARLRGMFNYHRASTGRWAGRKVQPHNFPKTKIDNPEPIFEVLGTKDVGFINAMYGDPIKLCSTMIRSLVKAPEGKILIGADWNAIEPRVLFWASGHTEGLRLFREGKDPYIVQAAATLNLPEAEITSDQRDFGKTIILGCGYGMGKARFYDTCQDWGTPVSRGVADRAVDMYRSMNYPVEDFWKRCEKCAKSAVSNKTTVKQSDVVSWEYVEHKGYPYLRCHLPSGRYISYYKPSIELRDSPYGMRPTLVYWGEKQPKPGEARWRELSTYGGKLVENIVQAISRDLLAECMLSLREFGLDVVLHIHDEVVVEAPADQLETAKALFSKAMGQELEWTKGIPLKFKVWVGSRWKK